MTRRKAKAIAATQTSDNLPPFVYNASFIAIAMVVAALAIFAH